MGPSAFRIAGICERLSAFANVVTDKGSIALPGREALHAGDPTKKYIHEIATACTELYEAALTSLLDRAFPIVLGGDHSLAAGSVAAAADWARRTTGLPIGLLWIDAHGDMNTPASSPSGNVHGMPLAALLGPEPPELSRIGGFSPTVRPEHTVLIGIRNLDERERETVRASGVHVFTMKDIDRRGIADVVEEAVSLATDGTAGLHVSFDMDVCDPSIAPGVGTPVKGGLDYREAHLTMEILADCGRLTSLDIVEVNPTLDIRNTTAELGVELVLSALGQKIF